MGGETMRRISIFVGLKTIELIGLWLLICLFAGIGYILDQLIDGIGHECTYNIYAFPDFFLFALFGFTLTVIGIGILIIIAIILTGLYYLIKKNWDWSERF